MRRLMTIDCGGDALGATLDEADGRTGLLIVSGGTQTRIGAHRGMARLAAAVAVAGFPVFRFDRRGMGDSAGLDPGFMASGPDIAAAAAAFRAACPNVARVTGFGLCDGATALILHHQAAGLDGLILANPWVIEPQAGLPPPAAIRRRYVERLCSPTAWRRLLTGAIDYRAAVRGVSSVLRRAEPAPLAGAMAHALERSKAMTDIVLANGDATAIAFEAEWRGARFHGVRDDAFITRLQTASHSFASGTDPEWLADTCIAALARSASSRL